MTGFDLGADQLRTILHLLGVTVWLGGQIVLLGVIPILREVGGDLPKRVAGAYGQVAWPAFGLIIATGIWNLLDVDLAEVSSGYNAAFGIKMLLVVATGLAAAIHQSTDKPAVRGISGGIGFVAAVAAFVLGIGMAH